MRAIDVEIAEKGEKKKKKENKGKVLYCHINIHVAQYIFCI